MTIAPYVNGRRASSQQGQAMVEGLIVLLALTALWSAIAWLGRLQDIDLQAAHASRYTAFAATRNPDTGAQINVRHLTRTHYFSGSTHQWADAHGARMLLNAADDVQLDIDRGGKLPVQAQPGGSGNAAALRTDWHMADTGIVASYVTVRPSAAHSAAWGISGLRHHTAILAGAGHAINDTQVQHRLATSALAWGQSAGASYDAGRSIAGAMIAVDAGWDRPHPVFDWLGPWTGDVPNHHLSR